MSADGGAAANSSADASRRSDISGNTRVRRPETADLLGAGCRPSGLAAGLRSAQDLDATRAAAGRIYACRRGAVARAESPPGARRPPRALPSATRWRTHDRVAAVRRRDLALRHLRRPLRHRRLRRPAQCRSSRSTWPARCATCPSSTSTTRSSAANSRTTRSRRRSTATSWASSASRPRSTPASSPRARSPTPTPACAARAHELITEAADVVRVLRRATT